MTEIAERICQLLKDTMIYSGEVTMETTLRAELRMDGIDIKWITENIEKEFDIWIPDESMNEFQTVGDIVKCVESLLK